MKQNFEIHGHNIITRKQYDLHTRPCSTVLYQKSVTNTGLKLYNKLPKQLKQIDDYKDFKKRVKIFSYTMYCIQLKNYYSSREYSTISCTFYLIYFS